MTIFSRFLGDESGATAIEYGLIAALMGSVIIIGIGGVSTKMSSAYTAIANKMTVN